MQIMIRKNKELLAAVLFFLPQWNYYLAALLSSHGLPTVTVMAYGLTALLAVFAYMIELRNRKCFFALNLVLLLLLLSCCWNPAADAIMTAPPLYASGAVSLLFYYFPVFFLMLSGLDLKTFYGYLVKLSAVILVTGIAAFLNYILVLRVSTPDYMSFAYLLLSSIFLCFSAGFTKRRAYLLLAVIGTAVVLIGGCRGALLTLSVFYVLCFFFLSPSKGSAKSWIAKRIVLLAAVLLLLNLDGILSLWEGVLAGIGYTSRTLDFLSRIGSASLSTVVGHDGRSEIWGMAIRNLNVWGLGLFGDRTVLTEGALTGVYAHNWTLEILLDFGLALGGILVLFLLCLIVKALIVAIQSQDIVIRVLGIAMFSILMVKHMLSASFLTSFDFWAYLGIGTLILWPTEQNEPMEAQQHHENRYLHEGNRESFH